jgi:hypothetical protein
MSLKMADLNNMYKNLKCKIQTHFPFSSTFKKKRRALEVLGFSCPVASSRCGFGGW